jgi:hypothetical protein
VGPGWVPAGRLGGRVDGLGVLDSFFCFGPHCLVMWVGSVRGALGGGSYAPVQLSMAFHRAHGFSERGQPLVRSRGGLRRKRIPPSWISRYRRWVVRDFVDGLGGKDDGGTFTYTLGERFRLPPLSSAMLMNLQIRATCSCTS